MFSVPLLVVIIVVLLFVYIILKNRQRPPNFPPGPPWLPLYGSYWFIKKENFNYTFKGLIKLNKKYKTDLLGFYMGDLRCVHAYKYDLVKEIMSREEFTGRIDNIVVRNRGAGDLLGVFFADGNFWKDQRWFSLRNMRDFGFGRRDTGMEDKVADEVRYLIDFLQSKPKPSDSDVCTERGIVKMPDIFFASGINCIHHTLSASHFQDYKHLREMGRAASNFLFSIDATGNSICMTPWLRYFAPEYFGWNSAFRDNGFILEFARKIIDDHKKSFNADHLRDFIDVYLNEMYFLKENKKEDKSFTEKQLEYLVLDYMSPAAVGVGHTLNYLFANLLFRPEIQEKIQQEIDRVVGRCRLPTLDDRKDMHYTEATLREVLRKDTLVPISIPRRCTKDTYLGGYFIPKDTACIPNIYGMHNDPELWGDPENFRPERFLDDDGKLVKKDITLPFGAGKRLCAGETFARNTIFLFATGILQNFTFRTPKGKPTPDMEHQINGITTAVPDFWVEAIPRL